MLLVDFPTVNVTGCFQTNSPQFKYLFSLVSLSILAEETSEQVEGSYSVDLLWRFSSSAILIEKNAVVTHK